MGILGDTRTTIKDLRPMLAQASETLDGASKEVKAAAFLGAVAFGAVALVAMVALLVSVSRPAGCQGHPL